MSRVAAAATRHRRRLPDWRQQAGDGSRGGAAVPGRPVCVPAGRHVIAAARTTRRRARQHRVGDDRDGRARRVRRARPTSRSRPPGDEGDVPPEMATRVRPVAAPPRGSRSAVAGRPGSGGQPGGRLRSARGASPAAPDRSAAGRVAGATDPGFPSAGCRRRIAGELPVAASGGATARRAPDRRLRPDSGRGHRGIAPGGSSRPSVAADHRGARSSWHAGVQAGAGAVRPASSGATARRATTSQAPAPGNARPRSLAAGHSEEAAPRPAATGAASTARVTAPRPPYGTTAIFVDQDPEQDHGRRRGPALSSRLAQDAPAAQLVNRRERSLLARGDDLGRGRGPDARQGVEGARRCGVDVDEPAVRRPLRSVAAWASRRAGAGVVA
jgi:hypothetical protein